MIKILSSTSAEGITAVESQGTHAENENTDAEQTSENM